MTLNIPSEPHSKAESFQKMQLKWFGKNLDPNESVQFTVAQLQKLHDEIHETGRLRERSLNSKIKLG